MLIYTDEKSEKINKIQDAELQYVGSQLQSFVEVYSNKVTLSNPTKDREVLHILNEIAQDIKNRDYHKLFADTSIVEMEDDDRVPF